MHVAGRVFDTLPYSTTKTSTDVRFVDGRSDRGETGKKGRRNVPLHTLCPDAATLDRYFAEKLHFFNPRLHEVAAMVELLPAWLEFLEQQGLLESELSQQSLESLKYLWQSLQDIMKDADDPTLAENLRDSIQTGATRMR